MAKLVVLATLMAVGKAPAFEHAMVTELTLENFDEQTAGKTVFIKFQAPW